MTLQKQIIAWTVLLAFAVLSLWVLRGILLPFVVGLALAYLLDPVADKLESWHISRLWATILILAISTLLFVGVFLLIVPLILQQVVGLAQRLPGYVGQLQELVNQWMPQLQEYLGEERAAELQSGLANLMSQGIGIAGALLAQITQSGLAVINLLGLLIISPVVAFYMLRDWDTMVAAADRLLPRQHKQEIRAVLKDIDTSMAAVIRGQVSVITVLSIYYATALSLTGLSFGLAIGIIAGILSFIPYVGFLAGFVLSVGIATVQFWPDWYMIVVIFAIFIIGQFLEGNVLYPNMVGSSLGVHPVWLMFALFAFGLIFGFVGLLLAVPLAAIASVMVRFLIRKYQASSLYLGPAGAGGDDTTSNG